MMTGKQFENERARGWGIRGRGISRTVPLWLLALLFFPPPARSQSLYYANATGRPAFNTPETTQLGFVNLANGDLHLEIPVASPAQRGSMTTNARIVYDSRIWEIVDNGTSESWQPDNLAGFTFSTGGWNWMASDYADVQFGLSGAAQYCGSNSYTSYYGPWFALSQDGTATFFPAQTVHDFGCGVTDVPSASAYDQESAGSRVSVTDYGTSTFYDHSGT